jgi:hypothetical protein
MKKYNVIRKKSVLGGHLGCHAPCVFIQRLFVYLHTHLQDHTCMHMLRVSTVNLRPSPGRF